MSTSSTASTPIDIIIDCRENKLIEALESEHLNKECGHMVFDIAQLDVGDIIYKRGDQIVCLIERKTLDDYASSIVDKRIRNQSVRISQLRKDNPQIQIIYLIEGQFISKDHQYRNGITRDSLYSSMINRVIEDKYMIYRTADINDTALIVTKIFDKLIENLSKHNGIEVDEKTAYLKTIKLSKKENMTANSCYLCQLSQIPGLSVDMAKIIATKYGSMYQLVSAYIQTPDLDGKRNLLSELLIPIANDKTRRLGNVLSKRIYEYICGEEKIKLKFKN
jgi:ERCC4-type nuclease